MQFGQRRQRPLCEPARSEPTLRSGEMFAQEIENEQDWHVHWVGNEDDTLSAVHTVSEPVFATSFPL